MMCHVSMAVAQFRMPPEFHYRLIHQDVVVDLRSPATIVCRDSSLTVTSYRDGRLEKKMYDVLCGYFA